MLNAHAVTPVICASRGTPRRCRNPAATSRRNGGAAHPGGDADFTRF